jgi:hypothetical protein
VNIKQNWDSDEHDAPFTEKIIEALEQRSTQMNETEAATTGCRQIAASSVGVHGYAALSSYPVAPCSSDFANITWMPFEPLTVCVTRRSAARLHSV